jgi:hypothetical protein
VSKGCISSMALPFNPSSVTIAAPAPARIASHSSEMEWTTWQGLPNLPTNPAINSASLPMGAKMIVRISIVDRSSLKTSGALLFVQDGKPWISCDQAFELLEWRPHSNRALAKD